MNPLRRTLLAGAGLSLCPRLPAWGAESAAPAAAAAAFTPIVSPSDQVYPALILATAAMPALPDADTHVLGDANGTIGARVRAGRDGQRARLTVQIPGLLQASTLDTVLPRAGRRYELYPVARWDRARLRQSSATREITVRFALRLDEAPMQHAERSASLRPINEAPYFVADGGAGADLAWIFAAYVDERSALVDTILHDAIEAGLVERFDGYASGDASQVYRQVFAVWRVLQRRGIRYSSITRKANVRAQVYSQYVRFLDESWGSSKANCVDGSVLIASVLRRIGIEPTLVLLPGHMLLAFDLDAGGAQRAYLETTLLGDGARADEERSFASFEAAVRRGFRQYHAAELRLADPREPEYVLLRIAAARRLGVQPIGPASS